MPKCCFCQTDISENASEHISCQSELEARISVLHHFAVGLLRTVEKIGRDRIRACSPELLKAIDPFNNACNVLAGKTFLERYTKADAIAMCVAKGEDPTPLLDDYKRHVKFERLSGM